MGALGRELSAKGKMTKATALQGCAVWLKNRRSLSVVDVLKDLTISLFPIMMGGRAITFGYDGFYFLWGVYRLGSGWF